MQDPRGYIYIAVTLFAVGVACLIHGFRSGMLDSTLAGAVIIAALTLLPIWMFKRLAAKERKRTQEATDATERV